MINIIKHNLIPLRELCKLYHVKNLFVFGSAAKGNFKPNSDLDFLVNFSSSLEINNYADNYFGFLEKLQQLFGRKIDLISEKSLKNPILIQDINESKVTIYRIVKSSTSYRILTVLPMK